MRDIFARFNNDFAKNFKNSKSSIKDFFDNDAEIKNKIKKTIELNNLDNKSASGNLDIPPVDNIVLYGNSLPTVFGYLYDPKKNSKEFTPQDKLIKSGDGTVPTWSSLLCGSKMALRKKSQEPPPEHPFF
jgi:hypothetical protein